MTACIAADPGINGAIAFYSTTAGLLEYANLPVCEIGAGKGARIQRKIDASALRRLLHQWSTTHKLAGEYVVGVVERMQPFGAGGASPVTLMSMGHSSGVIEGVLSAWAHEIRQPLPSSWKRAMGVTSDKATSQAAMRARFPDVGRVRHDVAEAILLAVWGAELIDGRPAA